MPGRTSGARTGNRYDAPMVADNVSDRTPSSTLLTARLHVDLCRLAGALCPRGAAA